VPRCASAVRRQGVRDERQRVPARGEPEDRVLGEHPLVGGDPAERQALVRVVERQLELAAAPAVAAAGGLGRQPQPDLPQELTPRELIRRTRSPDRFSIGRPSAGGRARNRRSSGTIRGTRSPPPPSPSPCSSRE
jgi:hypothetical protein